MRQRLGIVLALVGDPKMIVLDEPINGLDPQGIVEVRELLSRLRDERGITIMISSHILDELSKVADAYGIIHEGTLLDEFTAEELHERCGKSLVLRTDNTAETLRLLDNMGLRGAIHEPDGSLRLGRGMDQAKVISKAIVSAGIGLEEIYLRTMAFLATLLFGSTGAVITLVVAAVAIALGVFKRAKSKKGGIAGIVIGVLAIVLAFAMTGAWSNMYKELHDKAVKLTPDGVWAQASEDTAGGLMGIINKLPKDEATLNTLVEEMNELNKLVEAK